MYSEEILNNVRIVVDYMRIENMSKLERRKYHKSKLKQSRKRIIKENEE